MGRGLCLVAFAVAAISLGSAAHPHDEGCPNREANRGNDLCAQWKAADAATNAAYATWAAVFLSFGGTLLIALTFMETRKTARAELRPWVKVEVVPTKFEIDADGLTIGYDVVFSNIGRTTAQHFTFQTWGGFSRFEIGQVEAHYAEWKAPAEKLKTTGLMPGEQRSYQGLQSAMQHVVPWSGSRKQKAAAYVVAASAFYWSTMDNKWHRTDRSFTIGRKDDSFNSGIFLYDDMVGHGVDLVAAKPFWAGQTT